MAGKMQRPLQLAGAIIKRVSKKADVKVGIFN
jgi:hypothetical protein